MPSALLGRGLGRRETAAAKLIEVVILGLVSAAAVLVSELAGAFIIGLPLYMIRILIMDILDMYLSIELGLMAALFIFMIGGKAIHAMAGFFIISLDLPSVLLYYQKGGAHH